MKNAYLDALKNRARIGGMITPNDQLMLVKDLMERVDQLEEKYEETTTKAGARNSKVSKRKTTSS